MQFLSHLWHLPLLYLAPGRFRQWTQTFRTEQDKARAEFLQYKKIVTQKELTEKSFLADAGGNKSRLRIQTAWVQVTALPWACWVMLAELLHFVSVSSVVKWV